MTVCDWCESKGKQLFEEIVQVSEKPYDTKRVQLCRECYDKFNEYEASARLRATNMAKKERLKETGKEMFVDFNRVFHTTEQQKQEEVINYLQILINSVKSKSCITCKHCEFVEEYMHSYKTSEVFCKKKNKSPISHKNCDMYEVKSISELNGTAKLSKSQSPPKKNRLL